MPTLSTPSQEVSATPAAIANIGYQVGRPPEKYERASAPTSVWPSRPSAYTRITAAVAPVSRAVKAPRWKRSSTICGAQATTAAAPTSTVHETSARSRSTRPRARSVSPSASACATTGKVTVQSISAITIGICATFWA